MCRYAGKRYKPHFVCFDCRKQFKRPPLPDLLADQGTLDVYLRMCRARQSETARVTLAAMERDYLSLVSKCPQCAAPMADLGYDFKPPRSSAVRAWERLRGLYKLGRTWHTCGCNGPGYIPANQTDYTAYLKERLDTFTRKLKRDQMGNTFDNRSERVRYWTTAIEKVRAELATRGTRTTRRSATAR